MVYINRSRPSHFDALGRSEMRRRADTLGKQIESGQFEQWMREQRLDEATIEHELRRAKDLLHNRRRTADQDEG